MDSRRADDATAPAPRSLLTLVGTALLLASTSAACGTNIGSRNPTGKRRLAAIEATERSLLKDLEAGRYAEACNRLTSRYRARLAEMSNLSERPAAAFGRPLSSRRPGRGSCSHGLQREGTRELELWQPHDEGASPSALRALYRGISRQPLSPVLAESRIKGASATYKGTTVAREEGGQWRLGGIFAMSREQLVLPVEGICRSASGQSESALCTRMKRAAAGRLDTIPEEKTLLHLIAEAGSLRLKSYRALMQSLRARFSN
jgi:hypothetical protein